MKGLSLKFYTREFQKHGQVLLYEWLLEAAKKQGIKGGSVFKAISGFGRHGTLREGHFFEMASEVPVEIIFHVSEEEAKLFLQLLKQEKIDLFYSKTSEEFGSLSHDD